MSAWVGEGQAIGTLAVALAVAAVAYQQYRLGRQKLKLDLFDRRFEIYQTIVDAIVVALNGVYDNTFDENTPKLKAALSKARFIFASETFIYLDDLSTKIIVQRHGRITTRGPNFHDWIGSAEFLKAFHENQQKLLDSLETINTRVHAEMRIDDKLSFTSKPLEFERKIRSLLSKQA